MRQVADFGLIQFQEQVMEQLDAVERDGVGEHKHRSRRAIVRRAVGELVAKGYSRDGARAIVQDAVDMAGLERAAEQADMAAGERWDGLA